MDPFVVDFLTTNGLDKYIPTFKDARINKQRLNRINSDLAKELIRNRKHRVNLLLSLEELKDRNSDKPVPKKKSEPSPAKSDKSSKAEEVFQIFVRNLECRIITFMITSQTLVEELKAAIIAKEGMTMGDERKCKYKTPTDFLRLSHAGKQLNEGCTLGDYKIREASTVQMMLRLCGC